MSCVDFTIKSFSASGCTPDFSSSVSLTVSSGRTLLSFSSAQNNGCFSEVGGDCTISVCESDLNDEKSLVITGQASNFAGSSSILFPFTVVGADGIISDAECGSNDACDCNANARVLSCSAIFSQCSRTAKFFVGAAFDDGNDQDDNPTKTVTIAILNVLLGIFIFIAIGFWWRKRGKANVRKASYLSPNLSTHGDTSGNLKPINITVKSSKNPEKSTIPRTINVKDDRSIQSGGVITISGDSRKQSQITEFLKYFDDKSTILSRRLTVDTEVSNFDIKSFKTNVTEEDRVRIKAMRKESLRLSENMNRINFLLGLNTTKSSKNIKNSKSVLPRSAKDLVKDVFTNLNRDIWTAEMVRKGRKVNDLIKSPQIEPEIGLENYLYRLVTGLNRWFYEDEKVEVAGIRSIILSLVYIQKIKEIQKDFELTVYNVHRLFAVMMLVAAKFSEDEPILNGYWAEIAGVDLEELNSLEDDFCFKSGFDFFVKPSELAKMYEKFKLTYFEDVINFRNSIDTTTTRGRDDTFGGVSI